MEELARNLQELHVSGFAPKDFDGLREAAAGLGKVCLQNMTGTLLHAGLAACASVVEFCNEFDRGRLQP